MDEILNNESEILLSIKKAEESIKKTGNKEAYSKA